MSQFDTVVQALDWGGGTVTVDPLRHERWITDGRGDAHLATSERGRRFNFETMKHLSGLLVDPEQTVVRPYLPTHAHLEKQQQVVPYEDFAPVNAHGVAKPFSHNFKFPIKQDGKRPAIDSMHRRGDLGGEALKGDIERDMYRTSMRRQHQLDNRSDTPSGGLHTSNVISHAVL